MSDPTPPQPPTDGPALPPPPPYATAPTYQPPAYPVQPPAYPGPQPVQQYPGAAPTYPSAPYGYGGYAPAPRTNVLSIVAMIASILGFIWVLPLVGSLAGAIMGHISLNQLKTSGEKGRGMALAGVIVGWIGFGIILLFGIFFFLLIGIGASSGSYA
ncbi:DUF4190 domain-containing protein [uncultured Microbacterium sp.]|uniref:DUF4190 domain-containing protein n=1 Tax=uncultured Microbacterium sp. TaxID=191216 RepID=UPI0026031B29|nr:DUF4190 domain-containing protein [uncultured Microbacterium sp.]